MTSRRLLVATLASAVVAGLLAAPAAVAHSAFIGSSPSPGTRLGETPVEVTLRFTEPLNQKLSTAALVAVEGGDRFPVEVSAPTAKQLTLVPSGPLPRGAYRVEWHTVSTLDGHALEGTFSFGVRAPAAGGAHALEQSPLARDGWVRVVVRIALYASLLLFAGALLLRLLLTRAGEPSWLVPAPVAPALTEAAAARRRERFVMVDLGLAAALAASVSALADAADAAGSLSPDGISQYLLGSLPGFARVAVVLLVLLAGLMAARGARLAALPAALALVAVAASGHASSADPRLPTIVLDWVHLLAGAVWLGGIGLIAIVWGPALRRSGRSLRVAVARSVLPAFGRVALPAFLGVASTGAVSALVQLGHLAALWESAYGRVLATKVALVALIAGVSYLHALRLRPRLLAANPHFDERLERRHWRLLRSEPVLGLGVIAAVAVLVAFPLPPRQLGDADEALAAAAPCDPCPLPRPIAKELAVAEQAGSHLVAAWLRREDGRLEGTVRVLNVDGKPTEAPVRVVDAHMDSCGRGCVRVAAAPEGAVLDVAVRERGRSYVARLPVRWRPGASARARRLLERTQRTMGRLESLREVETVTSGPGSFARTVYRLQAPDRFAYVTNGGSESVVIGKRQWLRTRGSAWRVSRYAGGGPGFRMGGWFRWTPYAQEVRLLGLSTEHGRRMAELALMDHGTPVWLRLTVDLETMRAVRERMIAQAHYMTRRYLAFNDPVSIRPPAQ
jgi:copper transport protein